MPPQQQGLMPPQMNQQQAPQGAPNPSRIAALLALLEAHQHGVALGQQMGGGLSSKPKKKTVAKKPKPNLPGGPIFQRPGANLGG